MYNNIVKYIKKLLIVSIPFFLFLAWYIILDPFEVIWHYDDYYEHRGVRLSLNQGYVGVSNFENHYEQFKWDSFIFGNSRSRYWEINDWEKFLPPHSRGYHLDAHGETMIGLLKRFEWLDKKNIPIKNALICLDRDLLCKMESSDEHIFMIAPQLVNYKNYFNFQLTNFKTFCNYEFIKTCFAMWFSPNAKTDITDLITGEIFNYDYTKNQISFTATEREIERGGYYTEDLMNMMFIGKQHPDSIFPRCIREPQRQFLQKIANIMKKHHTDYKIVVNPLYNQIKLNPCDVKELKNIFGDSKIYNYSGVNEITRDYHNYYEALHYRSCVAKKMMKEIYKKD